MSGLVQAIPELKYIPVGTRFTREQIENLSQSQLAKRDILDPKFAGFDPNFDWHKYIHLDMKPGLPRAEAEVTFNQMSQTPEGQHIMRQAFAMQEFRDAGTQVDHRVVITGQKHRHILPAERADATNDVFLVQSGVVYLAPGDRHYVEYPTLNGNFHPFSVQSTLVHELIHAADALIVPGNPVSKVFENDLNSALLIAERDFARQNPKISKNGNEEFEKLGNKIYEAVSASVLEHAAIRAANTYLLKYYGTPERAIQHLFGDARDDKSIAEPSEAMYFRADGNAPLRQETSFIKPVKTAPPLLVSPPPAPPFDPLPVVKSVPVPVPPSPIPSLTAPNSAVQASRELLGDLPAPKELGSMAATQTRLGR